MSVESLGALIFPLVGRAIVCGFAATVVREPLSRQGPARGDGRRARAPARELGDAHAAWRAGDRPNVTVKLFSA
jgi:hypothetical protein